VDFHHILLASLPAHSPTFQDCLAPRCPVNERKARF
jgi:hypothetical protein